MTDLDSKRLRTHYPHFYSQGTRWLDNDIYGHINNTVYYSFFDTAVNKYLIDNCDMDIVNDRVVAYVVSSSCDYFTPCAYPADLEVGLKVNRLGKTSVEYGLAVFKQDESNALVVGKFTHVFVDRAKGRAVEIPTNARTQLEQLLG